MEGNWEGDESVVVDVKRTHARHRGKPTTGPLQSDDSLSSELTPIQSTTNMKMNDDDLAFANTTAVDFDNTAVNTMLVGNSTNGSAVPSDYSASASDMVFTFLSPVFLLMFCALCNRRNVPGREYHRGAMFRRQAERVWAIQRAKEEREAIPVEKRKDQIEKSLRKMKIVSKCPESGQCILAPEEEKEEAGQDVSPIDIEQGNVLDSEQAASASTDEVEISSSSSTAEASSENLPNTNDTTTKANTFPGLPGRAERRPLLSSGSEDSGDSSSSHAEKEEPALPPPDTYNSSNCYDFDDDEDVCPICLDNFEIGDMVMWSRHGHGSCSHAFHEDCLMQWLLEQRENECPTCRACFIGDPSTTVQSASSEPNTTAENDNASENINENENQNESDVDGTTTETPSGHSNQDRGDIEEGNVYGHIDNNVDDDQEDVNEDEEQPQVEQGANHTDEVQQNNECNMEIEDELEENLTYVIVKGSVQRVPL
eukprot:CAMPEP_0172358014 /NCGR_PEP_ID=MMETSP1060-20121228/2353_1 /TAXON_ID=37318 /ORGANISM="Pseudo-nitzschia pungens, Strain cf. cingulata" /LENGTH=482 /DNA_ID=CAMNT_0013079011 /DNA_START=288 /DNA_END=1736 /DNA_ORIENTATION=-